ncbi:MAG: MBOAT family protein [Deltaproteobacteria bacterium]|nr:MBOAT family protein [Deltaproteobacteria bacterium]
MLFVSLDYLLFLPLAVLAYWLSPRRWRLGVMGTASLAFYASWKLAYLPVVLGVILVAWAGALWVARLAQEGRPRTVPRAVVAVGLVVPLLVFKYWNWLSSDAEAFVRSLGIPFDLPQTTLPLPIGISFFTFQALAYVFDAGRDGKAEANPWRLGTFVSFFPQLVAGPIVRRDELIPTLRALPDLCRGQVGAGLWRIARGLVKKLLIADVVRVGMVDPMFDDPGRFTGLELLVGLYAFTLQIYYDFSGYTDMAIGSARLFGIELPENFRRPYNVTNITAYWRRWHRTLSLWVRHYIYFPLGGARVRFQARVYLNLLVTFLVLGVWHGASWNFVIYGLVHGSAMCVHRWFRKRHGRDPEDPSPGGWWGWTWRFVLTFQFVVLARILFRAPDLGTAWAFAEGLLHPSAVFPRFAPLAWAALAVGYAIHFTPIRWQSEVEDWFRSAGPVRWALVFAVVATACALLGTGEQLAFIYYQF